jgi:S-adenosylmethionine hydrolase
MKGVILSIAPSAQIVDISHNVPSFDVTEASIVIQDACRYFPAGTIHVVVVDPGVGSSRRPIAFRLRSTGSVFLAPDNGVLSLVSAPGSARHITNARLFHHPVSQTFHGRDIFAPVAAHLSLGEQFESLGPAVEDLVQLPALNAPTILRADKFGNLVTNLRLRQLAAGFVIRANGTEIRRLLSSYSEAMPGEVFAIEGSSGFIELSINQSSAADRLNLRRGAEFEVETGTLNP